MREIIPAKTNTTCDFCNKKFSVYDDKCELTITLNGDNGEGSGPAFMNGLYDVCNKCHSKIIDMINKK